MHGRKYGELLRCPCGVGTLGRLLVHAFSVAVFVAFQVRWCFCPFQELYKPTSHFFFFDEQQACEETSVLMLTTRSTCCCVSELDSSPGFFFPNINQLSICIYLFFTEPMHDRGEKTYSLSVYISHAYDVKA